MTGRRSINLAFTLIAAVAIGGWLWRLIPPPEPVYKGLSLSWWLNHAATQSMHSEHAGADSTEAIQAIGTNAIPTLLMNLQARDHPWNQKIWELLRNLHLTKYKPASAYERYFEAETAFEILRDQAREATPGLAKIFDQHISPGSQEAVIECLILVDPTGKDAVRTFFSGMTNASSDIRALTARALVGVRVEALIPALIANLDNRDETVSLWMMVALKDYGPEAKPALPALLAFMRDPKKPEYLRSRSLEAVRSISPETGVNLGVTNGSSENVKDVLARLAGN